MTTDQPTANAGAMIRPLRKHKRDGTPYTRPGHIDSLLVELAELPRDEILRRAAVTNSSDPSYLPSECLLHIMRSGRSENSDRYFERLFGLLSKRVIRALPRFITARGMIEPVKERVHELAYGRFTELIAADRIEYDERLDFFEVRWNAAIANLRRDAWEKALAELKDSDSLDDDETGELAAEVEKAIGSFDPFDPAALNEADYRLRLQAAIDRLPKEQIRIIEMLRQDIPIDSTEPGTVTIADTLGKSEKTIRNHRNRAFLAIKRTMTEGEEQ